jgi:hypothetical protein
MQNKELIQEVLEAVANINEQLYEDRGPEGNVLGVTIEPFTGIVIVEWGEYGVGRIWCSEDDDREYIEETDSYEPMEQYLRNTINKLVQELSKIKL